MVYIKRLGVLILIALTLLNITKAQSLALQNEREITSKLASPITDLALRISTKNIVYLGYTHIDSLGLLGNKPTSIGEVIANAKDRQHTYAYGYFIIQTNQKADLTKPLLSANQSEHLFYTIRAIEILKVRYNELYRKLVVGLIYPELYNHNFNNQYFNRYPKIIISFNSISNDIAISGTWLSTNPITTEVGKTAIKLYENFPYISINPILAKGENTSRGSYLIYQCQNTEANYLSYMKEGLLHSIVHELVHRYIDINNNRWNTLSNAIAFGNGRLKVFHPNFDPYLYDFEEVMVNRTIDKYFRSKGGLSQQLLDYYLKTEQTILEAIPRAKLDAYTNFYKTKLYYNEDYSITLK